MPTASLAWADIIEAKGLIDKTRQPVTTRDDAKPKPPALVSPLTLNRPDGTLVYVLPLETKNETNERVWRAKNRRAGKAWQVVRQFVRLTDLAPYAERLAAGGSVSLRFVRLGGRELDPMCNLPAALKGVEDAFAYLLGVDDRGPLWDVSCGQERGDRVGVRVEIA